MPKIVDLKIDRQSYLNTLNIPVIYLSGPISGLDWENCTGWRNYVTENLPGFKCLSPLRGKSYLKDVGKIDDSAQKSPGYRDFLASDQAIMTRDSFDTLTCDAVFVNLLGATGVSIGTVMEIAWAWEKRKPIVICMESNNLHNHPMIRSSSPFVTTDLDSGIDLIKLIFDR